MSVTVVKTYPLWQKRKMPSLQSNCGTRAVLMQLCLTVCVCVRSSVCSCMTFKISLFAANLHIHRAELTRYLVSTATILLAFYQHLCSVSAKHL